VKEKIMFPGWLQILLVVLLIVLLFGRGKISELMGDVAKGIKSFRTGLSEDDEAQKQAPEAIENGSDAAATATLSENKEKTPS